MERLREQRDVGDSEVEELRGRCEGLTRDVANREEQIHHQQLQSAEDQRNITFKDQEVIV